jgi:mycothiol synthase
MTISSHPYQHLQDFERLTSFLSHLRTTVQHSHCLHVGDLTWQLFHMLADYSPADLVQIWQDADAHILGFVLLYPAYSFFDLQLHPCHRGGALEATMLEWVHQHGMSAGRLSTLVNNRDVARVSLLTRCGYRPNGEWQYLERLLNDAPPHPALPSGFVLRSVRGDHEAAARATVLGAAFGAPPDPQRYQHFMHAAGYVRDLDLVAVAPDQRLAAFAMCWVDRVTKVGQFEPVGTAPEFRRQGVAQAVLAEGLRRMQQEGAERAIVIVEAAEQAASQLYVAVGFEQQWSLTLYTRSGSGG